MRKKIKFINCQIDVSRKVFSPRIETESWTRKLIREIERAKKPLEILDIFAGTGCIGIAILMACPELCRGVDFVDIDEEAIKQIGINLKINKISKKRYRVYKSDLFEKLKNKKYDFILANPPYVATDRMYEVQKEVLEKEPHIALFAGRDGLFYIKKFLDKVKNYLKPQGMIFLEFDPRQKEEIEKILQNQGFKFFFRKDQLGKCRWLKAGTK